MKIIGVNLNKGNIGISLMFFSFLFLIFSCADNPPDKSKISVDNSSGKEIYKIADSLTGAAEFSKSISSLKKFLVTVDSLSSADSIEIFNRIAMNFRKSGIYDSAFAFINKAISIGGEKHKNSLSLSFSYYYAGLFYKDYAETDSSLEYLNKSLGIRTKILKKDDPLIGDVYNNIGVNYERIGQFDKAEKYYKSALILRKQRGRFDKSLGGTYLNIGNLLRTLKKYEQSLNYYDSALAVREVVFGKSHPQTAFTFINIAALFSDMGMPDSSIAYNKKALKILEEQFPEGHPSIAVIYNNLGIRYLNIGDYHTAEQYFSSSIVIKKKLGAKLNINLANNYANLGECYFYLKEYDKAVRYYQSAESLLNEIYGEKSFAFTENLLNIAKTYIKKSEFEKGRLATERAVNLFRKTDNIPAVWKADFYHNAAYNFSEIYEPEKTIRYSTESNKYYSVLKYPVKVKYSENYYFISKMYFFEKNIKSAASACEIGLSVLCGGESWRDDDYFGENLTPVEKQTLIGFLKLRGEIYRNEFANTKRADFLRLALSDFEKAVKVSEIIRREYISEYSKFDLSAELRGLFDEAVETAYDIFNITKRREDFESGLNLSEKSKAAALKEKLNEDRLKRAAGAPDSTIKKEKEVWEKIRYFSRILEEIPPEDSAFAEENRARLFQAKLKLSNIRKAMEKKYPQYRKFFGDLPRLTLEGIRKNILAEGQTSLVYYIASQKIYLFIISQSLSEFLKIEKPSDLAERVGRLNDSIRKSDLNKFAEDSFYFYKLLFEPAEKYISSDRCLIVPDGAVNFIPFDALIKNNNLTKGGFKTLSYLVNEYAFGYSFSLGVLTESAGEQKVESFLGVAPGN